MNGEKKILELTWKEVEALAKEKTVLLVTLAPIEEHGLHLPLGVDIVEGKKWEGDLVRRLVSKYPDYYFLVMPALPIAHGCIGQYPGNLHFSQRTVRTVVLESLQSFVGWGIRNIVLIASHGNPRFQIAVEEACQKINRKYGVCAFSPLGAFFSYKELKLDLKFPPGMAKKLEAYPDDFHAGWIETSMMLDIAEETVGDYLRQPDTAVKEKEMMFPKKVEKKIAGFGHIGLPRKAEKSLGKEINENMAEYLFEAVSSFLDRQGYEKFQHHFLYRIPFLRTFFLRVLAAALLGILALLTVIFLL
ncbi:MAG: creatininase family protein [Candidatus Aminicenantes bacterium]|nr:creatininase family protein [Candidatus Aminicenantes bacterium]